MHLRLRLLVLNGLRMLEGLLVPHLLLQHLLLLQQGSALGARQGRQNLLQGGLRRKAAPQVVPLQPASRTVELLRPGMEET